MAPSGCSPCCVATGASGGGVATTGAGVSEAGSASSRCCVTPSSGDATAGVGVSETGSASSLCCVATSATRGGDATTGARFSGLGAACTPCGVATSAAGDGNATTGAAWSGVRARGTTMRATSGSATPPSWHAPHSWRASSSREARMARSVDVGPLREVQAIARARTAQVQGPQTAPPRARSTAFGAAPGAGLSVVAIARVAGRPGPCVGTESAARSLPSNGPAGSTLAVENPRKMPL